jgi:mannose-6-phosphate isomerase-like protein (cupin superfamily)
MFSIGLNGGSGLGGDFTGALQRSCPSLMMKSILNVVFAGVWVRVGKMTIVPISSQRPFTTKDGSTIRSILDRTNAPVANQSLAEATIPARGATQRHYHKSSEEFYFILEGTGRMEIDGEEREIGPGDAILIPPGAWHQIAAEGALRFLCCCAPAYAHEDTFFE